MKVKEFYTAAELDAMDAEDEAENEQVINPGIVSSTLSQALPIQIFKVADEDTDTVSSSQLLQVLDVDATNHNTVGKWTNRLIETYGFVEGEDYIALSYDANTLEGRKAIQKNGGIKVYDYMLTLDMAKEICMVDKTEIGRRVRRYFLVAEKVAKKHAMDKFQFELKKVGLLAQEQKALANRNEKLLLTASKKFGFKNITQMEQDVQASDRRAKDDTTKALEVAKSLMLQRGIQRMRGSKWNAATCESLFEVVERELARAEREGDCLADPF